MIDPHLELIDIGLAKADIALTDRPLRAALELIQLELVQISTDGGESAYKPGKPTEYVAETWFRIIYRAVERWYRDRFPSAFHSRSNKGLLGAVLICGTPFALMVPVNRIRPGDPARTIWLSFPDHIEDDDDVMSWLVKPPNLDRLSVEDRTALQTQIRDVAGRLRFVHRNLMGVKASDDALTGFCRGVSTHLERAAELIVMGDGDSVQKAWWELQMVIESALKGLLLQRAGEYPFTHKVSVLLDVVRPLGMAVDEDKFVLWPTEREMFELRYGQGARRHIEETFEA